jgi:hypothetical protein
MVVNVSAENQPNIPTVKVRIVAMLSSLHTDENYSHENIIS